MSDQEPLSCGHGALLVGGVAGAIHGNTLSHAFTWDDGYNIVENEAIRSLANVPSFFVEAWGAHADEAMNQAINTNYYRPVSLTSYALDHALFGLDPLPFHAVNVFLHGLCAALVLVIGWRLTERLGGPKAWRWGVTAGALLFAVHPVHTEVVNVITYRTDLLAALFYAAMLVVWLGPSGGRSPRAERWMIYGVAPLLYALGLGSKEMAVTAPGACFVLDLLVTARAASWRKRLARMAPLVAVLAAYLGARAALLSPSAYTYFADAPAADVATTMLAVFGRYVGLLISPWPLNPFYDWSILQPGAETQAGWVLGGAFLLVAWITATLVFARRRPVWALFLGFFPLVLVPVSHVSPIAVAAAERFLYLAMAGPLMALGLMAATLAETRSRRSKVIGVFALVLLMFSALTWVRNEDWRSDRAILEAAVRDWPTSYNHWYGLAKLEEREGFPERALPIYERLGRSEDVVRLSAP